MPGRLDQDPAYRRKVRRELWSNFSVLRHGAFDGLLVTSKNSGTHWVKYMLAVALAETYDVPPPAYFSEDAVRPYIGWPKDAPTFEALPRLAFSHTIPHRLMDWGWARAIARLPCYVLAVRHPMSILASHYAKWAHELDVEWTAYLAGDPSGDRYRCDLYWLARFWNRWGEIVQRDPDRVLIIRYEDTLTAPERTLRAIAAHWGIALSDQAVAAALRAGTKDEMAKKVDPAGERNVLQRRSDRPGDQFSGAALTLYTERIEQLFRFNLGYDLLAVPGAG